MILAALGGAIWYSQKHPPKPETETKPTVKVLSLPEDQISKIRILHPSGDNIALERAEDGKWKMTEPKPWRVDESTMSGMLGTLSSLDADQVVAENNTDWKSFGLDPGKVTVEASLKSGQTKALTLGDEAPASSVIYARLQGDGRVFGLATYVKSSLDKSVSDLRDKRLLAVNQDKLVRLTLTNKNGSLEFGKSGNNWQFVKPRVMRADTYAVDDLVRAAQNNFDSVLAEDEKAAAKYSFSSPYATLEVVDDKGVHQVTIAEEKGKKKDQAGAYYAKTTAMPGVYKITSSTAESLNKKLDNFRNARIFDLGGGDPDKLELRDGDFRVTLEKKSGPKGDKWMAGTKQVTSEKAQAVLGALRRIQAKSYPSDNAADRPKYGLDKPPVELKWASERVLLAGKDDQAYAAREGDPTTYEIDAADLKDLRKAISELK